MLVSISHVGCFLIPYLICLVVAGAPLLILEVCLGQLASQGGITAWLICPIFQGLFEEFKNTFNLMIIVNRSETAILRHAKWSE